MISDIYTIGEVMINSAWIKRYTPFIHKKLAKMKVIVYYGDQTSIDDLTQEVIIKAIERQDKYDSDKGAIPTWLSMIINDVVSEMKRKTKDAMTHLSKSIDNSGAWSLAYADDDSSVDGHDVLAAEDALYADQYSFYVDNNELIDYHLIRLSPRLSSIVRMKLVNGLTHKEIAKVMNISEENSRISYMRGLQNLKDLVRDG